MFNLNMLCLAGNFLAVSTSLVIAIFVYAASPRNRTNLFFVILNLLIGFWCLCPILINTDFISHKLLIQKISYSFALFLVPVFAEIVSEIIPQIKKLKFFLYLISYTFLVLLPTTYFIKDIVLVNGLYQTEPGLLYYFFIGYFGVGVATVLYILKRFTVQHENEVENVYRKDVSKFLVLGYGVEYIAGIVYFLTVLRLVPIYSFAGYIVWIGVSILFFVYHAGVKYDFAIENEKKQDDFQYYLTETTKALIAVKSFSQLSSDIENVIKRNTGCIKCVVSILEKDKYINYKNEISNIELTHSLIPLLHSKHEIISNKEVKQWMNEIKTPNFIEINEFLEKYLFTRIIPLFFGNLIGFICVGAKKEGKEYNEQDKKVFDLVGYSGAIAIQNILLETNTIQDDLTQLYNKKYFNNKLKEYVNISLATGNNFSLAFLDIDNFGKLNETLGHIACDEKLKAFAQVIKNKLRINDFIARWGGEEIIVLFPNTPLKDSCRIIEGLLKTVEQEIEITFSAGLVFFDGKDEKYKTKNIDNLAVELTDAADANMYQAKNNGKNQIYPNH